MKCPDCGTHLSDIQIDGLFLYRCYRCGGFWGDTHTFAGINPHSLASMRRVKIDSVWLKGGTGICPQDGLPLQPYYGEDVSDQIHVRSCIRCGKRWYSGDGLFEQKLAGSTVGSKLAAAPRVLFLSLVVLALIGAVAGSVNLVQQRRQTSVKANVEVSYFTAAYLKSGEAEVVFESASGVSEIEYRVVGNSVWVKAAVLPLAKNAYTGLLKVNPGSTYEVRIHGQVFRFTAQ